VKAIEGEEKVQALATSLQEKVDQLVAALEKSRDRLKVRVNWCARCLDGLLGIVCLLEPTIVSAFCVYLRLGH